MTDKQTIESLNQLSQNTFIAQLDNIFEHSSWVAEQTYPKRPFNTVAELHKTMFDIVLESSIDDRLRLIRNHPELAGKETEQGTLTTYSKKEQSTAGLDQCTADELEQLHSLNKRYLHRFGFPFVIAVSGLNKHQIIAAMQERLLNDHDTEFAACIREIGKIGRIRLDALFDETS